MLLSKEMYIHSALCLSVHILAAKTDISGALHLGQTTEITQKSSKASNANTKATNCQIRQTGPTK